jgi:hypothetical protein
MSIDSFSGPPTNNEINSFITYSGCQNYPTTIGAFVCSLYISTTG